MPTKKGKRKPVTKPKSGVLRPKRKATTKRRQTSATTTTKKKRKTKETKHTKGKKMSQNFEDRITELETIIEQILTGQTTSMGADTAVAMEIVALKEKDVSTDVKIEAMYNIHPENVETNQLVRKGQEERRMRLKEEEDRKRSEEEERKKRLEEEEKRAAEFEESRPQREAVEAERRQLEEKQRLVEVSRQEEEDKKRKEQRVRLEEAVAKNMAARARLLTALEVMQNSGANGKTAVATEATATEQNVAAKPA